MHKEFVNRRPFLVIAIAVSLFFIPLLYNSTALWQTGSADNAFLVDLTNEIAATGKPFSGVANAVDQAFAKIYLNPPMASELCDLPLNESFHEKFNYFNWHTYFVLYVIAPLTYLIPSQWLLPWLNSLSHFALLMCIVFFFFRKNSPPLLSVLAVLITVLHPAWSDGLQGQIYVDRLVYPFSFLYLYSITEWTTKGNLRLSVALAAIITLLSDRFGITLMLITMGYIASDFLSHRDIKKIQSQWPVLLIGISCAIVSVLIIKNFIHHPSYNNFGAQFSMASLKHNWTLGVFRQNTWKFIALNFVCLSPVLFFSRYWLIAVGLMAINIIINIGGAEKIGYGTHYHANYFPILIFACCDGLARAYNVLTRKRVLAVVFMFLSLVLIIPHASTGSKKFVWQKEYFPIFNIYNRALLGTDKNKALELDVLRQQIPRASKVSMPEHAMPTFVSHSLIQYFPLGLSQADYAIIPTASFTPLDQIENAADPNQPGMLIMYKGREEEIKANLCLSKKLITLGYKEFFKSSQWMILKRAE